MRSEPVIAVDQDEGGSALWWCCGFVEVHDRMVHLGDHPEVHPCVQCAHFVSQQAWQIEYAGRHSPGPFARDQLRNLRADVMRRGWHQNKIIGGKLRWLGEYVP